MTKVYPIVKDIIDIMFVVVVVFILSSANNRIKELSQEVDTLQTSQDSIKTYMRLDIRVLEEKVKLLTKKPNSK